MLINTCDSISSLSRQQQYEHGHCWELGKAIIFDLFLNVKKIKEFYLTKDNVNTFKKWHFQQFCSIHRILHYLEAYTKMNE